MTLLRHLLIMLWLPGIAAGVPAYASAQDYVDGAERFVSSLADEAIGTLTQASLSSDDRKDLFRGMLSDGFAIPGIARFVMGRYWRDASSEERDEYVQLFEDVIVALWANRFTEYSGQQFQITEALPARSARADEKAVLVRSLFWTGPENPVRLDWRVANKGDVYKITDVVVEGVSMANTYREEFASVMRKDGVSGLLADLRSRRDSVQSN